jgi:hypothetical protein
MRNRGAELAEIDRHVSVYGVTLCPPAYADAVLAALPRKSEAERLAAIM